MKDDKKDFGYELSEKSVLAFQSGSYIEAFVFQVEMIENGIPLMIVGRARNLRMSSTKVRKLAYKGTLEKKIDNLIEICGNDFDHFCTNLHEYRERRNRLTHRKTSFKSEEEMNDFARETWLIGTLIIFNFCEAIGNFPGLEE